jgi:hypothetical protein
MPTVIDTTHDCSEVLDCLKAAGYDTLIRYYSRPGLEWKRVSVREAAAIARAGLKLAAVYQNRQNQDADFSEAAGNKAGRDAHDYAREVIRQPGNSAIYFSADYDASAAAVTNKIIPFFQGIHAAFGESEGGAAYKVGIYGSGRTCRMLRDKGLVEYCWITQSTGFSEYQKFLASGAWNLKQLLDTTVCKITGDPNEINPAHSDFGAFTLDPGAFGPAAPAATVEAPVAPSSLEVMEVIASAGLRLRAGPGVDFDVRGSLAPRTPATILSRSGDWAMVDVSGDGLADGFVHSAFLRPV